MSNMQGKKVEVIELATPDIEAMVSAGKTFLWIAIVSSAFMLLAYEIWNIWAVTRYFRRLARKI